MIKRYENNDEGEMEILTAGAYVFHSDHVAIVAELANELRHQKDLLKDMDTQYAELQVNLDKAIVHLRKIANCDFRGNRSQESVMDFHAVEELTKGKN